jgi:ribose transport system ATP-binding protein
LFGDTEIERGTILKNGKEVVLHHPSDAIRNGIAYVPDDRKAAGLFLEKTVAENISVAKLKGGWFNRSKVEAEAVSYQENLRIKTPSVNQVVRQLSGGNQQKVVMAKWLNTAPDVFIFNEPTHGVDVGAKGDIYAILKSLTAEGKSIVLISSELPELLLVADRIAVMYNGAIQAILSRDEATEETLAALASGV